jgi:lysozyme
MNKTGKTGIAAAVVCVLASPLVAYHEGVIPYTYADPIGIPTVCAGETGPHVQFGQRYTVAECMAMLDKRLVLEWGKVERCITRELEPHQAVAILSWSYNVGDGAACKSTLIRMVNAGAPASQWCAQLDRWTYAGKRQWKGLVRRRAEERAICEGKAS